MRTGLLPTCANPGKDIEQTMTAIAKPADFNRAGVFRSTESARNRTVHPGRKRAAR
jgi:hypothetical protein